MEIHGIFEHNFRSDLEMQRWVKGHETTRGSTSAQRHTFVWVDNYNSILILLMLLNTCEYYL